MPTTRCPGNKERREHRPVDALATLSKVESDPAPAEPRPETLGPIPPGMNLPRLARRRYSRAGFKLLEVVRVLEIGVWHLTTYETLRRETGLKSFSSISKGLRELAASGVAEFEEVRDKGKVAGTKFRFLGFPESTPEVARDEYRKPLASRRDRVHPTERARLPPQQR